MAKSLFETIFGPGGLVETISQQPVKPNDGGVSRRNEKAEPPETAEEGVGAYTRRKAAEQFAKPDAAKGDGKGDGHIFDKDRSRTVESMRNWIAEMERQQAADVAEIARLRADVQRYEQIAKQRGADLATHETITPECRFEPGGTGRKFFLRGITSRLHVEAVTANGDVRVVELGDWLVWTLVND